MIFSKPASRRWKRGFARISGDLEIPAGRQAGGNQGLGIGRSGDPGQK